jgi:hypothetical protein
MAIGLDRSAGYSFAGLTGVLNGIQYTEVGQSVVFYVVAAGVNLSAEDDAANEAFEAIIQAFPPVLAYLRTRQPQVQLVWYVTVLMHLMQAYYKQHYKQSVQEKGAVNLGQVQL